MSAGLLDDLDVEAVAAGLAARRTRRFEPRNRLDGGRAGSFRGAAATDQYLSQLSNPHRAHDALALSLLNGLSTYSDRVQTLARVAEESNSAYLRFLATGDPRSISPKVLGQLAPDEYSFWAQEVAAGQLCSDESSSKTLRLCQKHLRDGLAAFGVNSYPLGATALAGYFAKLDVPGFKFSLMRLSDAFARLHSLHWTWAGVGPFLYFLQLVDPREKVDTAILRALETYSRLLKLSVLFRRLLVLRAFSGDETCRDFLIQNAVSLAEMGRFGATDAKAWQVLGLEPPRTNEGDPDPGLLAEAIAYQIRLSELIAAGETKKIIKAIPQAYAIDSNLVYYLDWRALDAVLPTNWTSLTMHSVLCAALFDDKTIETRCPIGVFRRGPGAFFSILDQLVTGYRHTHQQKDTVSVLLKELGELPQGAARYLFPKISEKSVLERLPYSFIPHGTEGQVSSMTLEGNVVQRAPKAERRSTINRLHLITRGLAADLMNPQRAREIIEQERRLLWTMVLREAARKGRIRIDIVGLGNCIQEELSADVLVRFARGNVGEPDGDQQWRLMLRGLIAQNVATHVLAGENWSFAGALSSNLKHGVIKPRVLRSFADGRNGKRSSALSASAARAIENAQLTVGEIVTRFMTNYLTFRKEDAFWSRVRETIEEALRLHWSGFQSQTLEIADVAEPLAVAVFPLLTDYLQSAKRVFDDEVRTEVRAEIQALSGKVPTQYFERLNAEMEVALDEASSWIQISAPNDESDFSLEEVVQCEIESFFTSQHEAMNVRTINAERHGDRERLTSSAFRFSGKYNEVLREAVHNVLLNAVEHSGLALDTSIRITCLRVRDSLHLVCENTFDPKRREQIRKGVQSARASLAGDTPGRAHEVKGSGFAKIKSVSRQLLGAPPKIVVQDVGARSEVFNVSIQWLDGFQRMAAHQ